MKKKTLRTAQEEITGIVPVILFSILWYTILIRLMVQAGAGGLLSTGGIVYLLFAAAGLLPIYTVIQKIRKAMYYRKLRKRTIAHGRREKGRIVNVIQRTETLPSSRGRTRMRTLYFLSVEITDSASGAVYQIESDAYSKPPDRWLASPEVTVYTDASGWKRFLEDFRFKHHKDDPGIFPDRPEFREGTGFYRVMEVIIIVLMLLVIVSQLL